ncbi:Gfo/Idh/MocA family protein [Gemmobacter serpentinus]|uniref:Gfo/Idh/MocA family protein n=1 Tax=Gemmobacter serpentinus TaxID=2652247 RepID=UPI00124C3769|nr:Gfo/Idh/MocA family oxidoreductase [Gemmobacter serpentinus]
MAGKIIRFGIIGCGLMGRELASAAARWLHLSDAKARPEIVAVCDTNPGLMDWFATHLPSVRQTTTDYRELLANPEVDAVYCAVPHVLHAEIYPQILAAGKHLFGEKPFGMDAGQNAVIDAAVKAHPDVLVRCSSEMPFYPGAQRVIDFVRQGHIGEVLEVEAAFLHSSDINPDKPINWKRMIGVNGEYGCMGDLGMHVLHVPLRLGWRPESVSASLVKRVTTRPDGKGNRVPCETWDNATITGTVPAAGGDFPLVLKTWRIAPGESNTWSIRVLGMKGSAFFTTKSPRQWQFMRYEAGGPQCWQVEDLGYQSVFPTITGGIFEFGFTDAIQQMWAAFIDELEGGTANGFHCATPQEAADHHAVLTAALEAGKTGQVVPVAYGPRA